MKNTQFSPQLKACHQIRPAILRYIKEPRSKQLNAESSGLLAQAIIYLAAEIGKNAFFNFSYFDGEQMNRVRHHYLEICQVTRQSVLLGLTASSFALKILITDKGEVSWLAEGGQVRPSAARESGANNQINREQLILARLFNDLLRCVNERESI